MRKIRKATVCEAFGKYNGQGYFVILHDGYDNQAMDVLPFSGVYKTKAEAERVAAKVLGKGYSRGRLML